MTNVTPAAPIAAKPVAPSRMTLSALVRGKLKEPVRAVIYGVEGVGKSTFGADAPSPIFLGAEDGTAQLDITRFPTPTKWVEVLEAIRTLGADAHDFKTLVIDTLDWLEPMLWTHICARDTTAKNPLKSVEDYGYGKGYQAAVDEWRVFLGAIEAMRRAKPMHVVFVAHSWIKPFKNPEGEDYDRYEMKLDKKASGLIREWADAVLFANHETFVNKDTRTKRVRGVSTGARLIHTQRTAAYEAKNRYGLPEQMPLSWADFFAAAERGQTADPLVLTSEIERKADGLSENDKKAALAAITRANGDASKLAQLNSWVNAKLAERTEA